MEITGQQAIVLIAINGRSREGAREMLNSLQNDRDEGYITVPAGMISYDRAAQGFRLDMGHMRPAGTVS